MLSVLFYIFGAIGLLLILWCLTVWIRFNIWIVIVTLLCFMGILCLGIQ